MTSSTQCLTFVVREHAVLVDAFAIPELYAFLETENYLYAIRLKSNAVLERQIDHLLIRPVGRPPKKPVVHYHDFMYQAGSWDRERRVASRRR